MFFVMLLLDCLTPLVADDYTFAFSYLTGERLQNLGTCWPASTTTILPGAGVLSSNSWLNGSPFRPSSCSTCATPRSIPGWTFDLLARQGPAARPRPPLLLLLIFLSLWEISPVFGQTNLWMCGSCNYLWASFFCLAALLPFGLYLRGALRAPPLASLGRFAAGAYGRLEQRKHQRRAFAGFGAGGGLCAVHRKKEPRFGCGQTWPAH